MESVKFTEQIQELINRQSDPEVLKGQFINLCDAEKRRIGHDLHDSLGQQLTGISLFSKALAINLTRKNIPEATDAAAIANLVDASIEQVRAIAADLAPQEIVNTSTHQAIELLCHQIEKTHQIKCAFFNRSTEEIWDTETTKHLFLIAKEAIHNAIRHAHTEEIQVELTASSDCGTLSIQNTGDFDEDHYLNSTGMGLSTMRWRAELMDGSLDIKRLIEGQLLVTCHFKHTGSDHDHCQAKIKRKLIKT